jgi:hypothetical protein
MLKPKILPKLFKYFLSVSLSFFSIGFIWAFALGIEKVSAVNVVPSNIYNIDQDFINQQDNFNQPDSIYVVPLLLEADTIIQDSEWYEGTFYYVASRLNQGDFLSHYFVSKDGQVLQGNHKGDEQRFNISGTTEKPIIITYFSQKDQTDFPTEVRSTLKALILDLANLNGIKLEKVSLKSVEFILKTNEPVFQQFTTQNGKMELTLKEIIKEIQPSYKPIVKNYQLSVEKIDLPAGEVSYGDDVEIGITVRNNSSMVLYQGTDYEPIISKIQNESSKFYVNGVWLSLTQSSFMTPGSMIKPGESKKFSIKLRVPLYFGEQKETFQLINSIGKVYLGTSFDITINIRRTGLDVVEITQTETGQLNVREGPWYSSPVISRVTPGQRFIVLERTNTGYVKLDIGSGKSGWVVVKYTKTV